MMYTIFTNVSVILHVLDDTHNEEGAFQIVGLAVAQKVTDHDNGEHKQNNHEDLEIEIHIFPESPPHYDYKGSVEQGCLDRRADAVEESEVLRNVNWALQRDVVFRIAAKFGWNPQTLQRLGSVHCSSAHVSNARRLSADSDEFSFVQA